MAIVTNFIFILFILNLPVVIYKWPTRKLSFRPIGMALPVILAIVIETNFDGCSQD